VSPSSFKLSQIETASYLTFGGELVVAEVSGFWHEVLLLVYRLNYRSLLAIIAVRQQFNPTVFRCSF
jgi:hypothetical protein